MTKRKTYGIILTSILFVISFACGMAFTHGGVTASAAGYALTLEVDQAGARVAYGPGWGAEAAGKVKNAFSSKLTELGATASGNIEIQKATSDGDALVFGLSCTKGTGTEQDYLVYNVLDERVYVVPSAYVDLFKREVRRIGAPVTDQLTGVNVTGYDGEENAVNETDVTVQVYETGMIIDKNGSPVKHEGVVEKKTETEYVFHPLVNDQDILANGKGNKITVDGKSLGFIGDVDGTWHALRTARTFRANNKLAVEFNFRAGCIKVVYNDDYTLDSRMAYAGQNFAYDSDGHSSRVPLPRENFTTDEHLWEENGESGVDSSALTMYRNLSGMRRRTTSRARSVRRIWGCSTTGSSPDTVALGSRRGTFSASTINTAPIPCTGLTAWEAPGASVCSRWYTAECRRKYTASGTTSGTFGGRTVPAVRSGRRSPML